MTDSYGVVRWSADYKPFGEVNITTSDVTNNLRYPGMYFDAETGLIYNMNRTYNKDLGRYIEADPIGIAEGENPLYVYVKNNPVNSSDPFGLWTIPLHRKLTQNALMKVNCSKAAGDIAAYNAAVDKGDGQQPWNAYWHAMSDGRDNPPNKALAIALWQARVDAAKTSFDKKTIGEATHALQDYFTPAHRGFKPWSNHWWEYFKHIGDADEGAESAMAENATAALLSGIVGGAHVYANSRRHHSNASD